MKMTITWHTKRRPASIEPRILFDGVLVSEAQLKGVMELVFGEDSGPWMLNTFNITQEDDETDVFVLIGATDYSMSLQSVGAIQTTAHLRNLKHLWEQN